MTYSRILAFLLILFSITACKPNQQELNKLKRAEVIAVHDEVMPKLGQLKSLQKQAETKIDSLELSENPDNIQIENLKTIAYELNSAYDGMFVWMRQYSSEDDQKSPEEVKVYLEDQMTKVDVVNLDIKATLEKAEEALKD